LLSDALDAVVSVYRGWHDLESRIGGPRIIDFDLAPSAFPIQPFESRIQVFAAVEKLAIGLPGGHAFLRDRLEASLALLRALMGQHIPFARYLSQTMRLDAVPIPAKVITEQSILVRQILDRAKLDFERGLRGRAAERFVSTKTGGELRSWLIAAVEGDATRAARLLVPETDFELTFEFAASPGFWKAWANADAGQRSRVSYNLTPRTPYLRGDAFLLAHHEVTGHVLQMECWRKLIAGGHLHPAYGVTVVHSSEQFQFEGAAQTITDLIYDNGELDDDVLWAREYRRYGSYVYQRAHLDLNTGRNVAEVMDYLRASLPLEEQSAIEAELRGRCLDPVLRAYQFVYAASDMKFGAALRAGGKAGLLRVLKAFFKAPHTLDQVTQLLETCSSSSCGAVPDITR